MDKKISVQISTKATYLPEQSSVDTQRYLWSYEIGITNESNEIIQLLNRHWRITDLTGHVEEVRGPGVIGLQPIIKPGKSFVYSSFCQLTTPHGSMEGNYEMQTLEDVHFLVPVPNFVLSSPAEVSAAFRARLH